MKDLKYVDAPEMATLRVATRFTVIGISLIYVLQYNLIFLYYTNTRTPGTLILVVASFLLISAALFFNHHPKSPLFALSALLNSCVTIVFFGSNPDLKATASTAIFIAAQAGIVTLPKRYIPGWVFLNTLLLITTIISIGATVEIFGIEMYVRTFTVLQLLVVSFLLWKTWFPLLDLVQARDILNRRLIESRESAIQLQERTRKWRELLVHTHETVLNDIRSVLDSKNVDFDLLSQQIKSRKRATKELATSEHNFSDLMAQVQDSVGIEIDLNISGAGTEIPHHLNSALRSVIVEVCRNFERHSQATKINSKASLLYGVLRIELFHNGKDLLSNSETGIGQGVVIKETLNEINGKAFRRINGVELSISLNTRIIENRNLGATDVARVLTSTVAVGNAVGGILFSVALMNQKSLTEIAIGSSVVALTAIAAFTNWKKIEVGNWRLGISATLATIQVAGTNFAVHSTFSKDVLALVTVLAGFALLSIMVWAKEKKWWFAALPWYVGLFVFRLQIDQPSSGTTIASLNTGFGLPLFAAAALFGMNRSAKRLKESQDLSELEIRENAAATAVEDLAKELDSAINQATKSLQDIAKSKSVSQANKNRLKQLDSLIQVDPKTSGGFSKAALEIVKHATENEIFVKVLAVRDQGVLIEISDDLLEILKDLISNCRDGKSSIQVLSNSESSILVLKVSATSAKRFDLTKLESHASENIEIRIEDDGDSQFIFLEQIA